ncbi:hypothetical protein KIN20_012342 [Parelaphostrongylus tenuis]|uniref:Uncharacterized protein n=1 Tax=Parelaphostrongylus tenuis TaxID=148309 RepID=A0AAD5MUL9_PARTN|nr:hypothetical protein KIN20_012342 [Parelaphostrongylus tenuis]
MIFRGEFSTQPYSQWPETFSVSRRRRKVGLGTSKRLLHVDENSQHHEPSTPHASPYIRSEAGHHVARSSKDEYPTRRTVSSLAL